MEAVERDHMSMETDLQSEDYVDLFDLNKLKKIVSDLFLNPIILESSVHERIKRFSKDLGEIFLYFFEMIMKMKDIAINKLKELKVGENN